MEPSAGAEAPRGKWNKPCSMEGKSSTEGNSGRSLENVSSGSLFMLCWSRSVGGRDLKKIHIALISYYAHQKH